jgi:hypothetical protein
MPPGLNPTTFESIAPSRAETKITLPYKYTGRKTQKGVPVREARKTRRHRSKEHWKTPRRFIRVVLPDLLWKCFLWCVVGD